MRVGRVRSLDIATAMMKADVAAERHCYHTGLAYLDVAEALIDGRDTELDSLYAACNSWSCRERAADATA